MLMGRADLSGLVLAALRDVVETADPEEPLELGEVREDTRLIGDTSVLTSMQLVSLLVEVEQRVEEAHGIAIVIADERALSLKRSPFRTVGTLVDYLSVLMAEASR